MLVVAAARSCDEPWRQPVPSGRRFHLWPLGPNERELFKTRQYHPSARTDMGVRQGAYGAYAYAPGRRTKNGVGLRMSW